MVVQFRQDPTAPQRGNGRWAAATRQQEEEDSEEKNECFNTRARHKQTLLFFFQLAVQLLLRTLQPWCDTLMKRTLPCVPCFIASTSSYLIVVRVKQESSQVVVMAT